MLAVPGSGTRRSVRRFCNTRTPVLPLQGTSLFALSLLCMHAVVALGHRDALCSWQRRSAGKAVAPGPG